MSKVRVHAFTISLDGYGAGPDQDLKNPLGVGGMTLHQWFVTTRTFQQIFGKDGGETGIDDDFAARGVRESRRVDPRPQHVRSGARAVAGRELEGLVGRQPALSRAGVRAHASRRARRSTMEGGTTFHFVTDGIEAALKRAKEAAGGKDVRIGGGAATIRHTYRRGSSTRCTSRSRRCCSAAARRCSRGIDLPKLGYERVEHVPTAKATHVVIRKRG